MTLSKTHEQAPRVAYIVADDPHWCRDLALFDLCSKLAPEWSGLLILFPQHARDVETYQKMAADHGVGFICNPIGAKAQGWRHTWSLQQQLKSKRVQTVHTWGDEAFSWGQRLRVFCPQIRWVHTQGEGRGIQRGKKLQGRVLKKFLGCRPQGVVSEKPPSGLLSADFHMDIPVGWSPSLNNYLMELHPGPTGDFGHYCLCLSSDEHVQATQDALKAFAMVKATLPEAALVVWGIKSHLKDIQRLAAGLELGDAVIFATDPHPVSWIHKASFVFHATYAENLSLDVVCTLSQKKALVLYDGQVTRSFFKDHDVASFAKKRDIYDLSLTLKNMWQQTEVRKRLATAAESCFDELYTLESVAQKYKTLYRMVGA